MLFEDKERLDLISISLFHNLFLLFVLGPLALVGRSGESEGSPLTIIGNCVLFQVRNIKISCDFIYSTSKRNEYVWPIQLCIPQELFIPRFHNCHQEVRLDESRCSLTFVVNESLSLSLSRCSAKRADISKVSILLAEWWKLVRKENLFYSPGTIPCLIPSLPRFSWRVRAAASIIRSVSRTVRVATYPREDQVLEPRLDTYEFITKTTDNPRRNKIFWTASNAGLVGLVAK